MDLRSLDILAPKALLEERYRIVRLIGRGVTGGPAAASMYTYDGAGHAFDNPLPAFHHPEAARRAWDNTVTWLSRTAPTS